MFSRSPKRRFLTRVLVAWAVALACSAAAIPLRAENLRVCSDPNNLPFSNARREGFENRIAAILARDFGGTVDYTWWAQRRGFFRNTLKTGRCDVVMGIPATGFEMAQATRPYYRSSYFWISRKGSHREIGSFDDPRLKDLRIGVQLVGDDYTNTPPAHALMRRGLVSNIIGFTLYGDYSQPNPPARIVEAVAAGKVDVALVWGPLAGYFAARSRVPLSLKLAEPPLDLPGFPFVYDIALGVRRKDTPLRERLDAALARHHREIDRILDAYSIPRLKPGSDADRTPTAWTTHVLGTGGAP
jgi:mxaJ protein